MATTIAECMALGISEQQAKLLLAKLNKHEQEQKAEFSKVQREKGAKSSRRSGQSGNKLDSLIARYNSIKADLGKRNDEAAREELTRALRQAEKSLIKAYDRWDENNGGRFLADGYQAEREIIPAMGVQSKAALEKQLADAAKVGDDILQARLLREIVAYDLAAPPKATSKSHGLTAGHAQSVKRYVADDMEGSDLPRHGRSRVVYDAPVNYAYPVPHVWPEQDEHVIECALSLL